MNKNWIEFGFALGRFLLFACTAVLAVGILMLDVVIFDSSLGEASLTEITQEAVLVLIIGVLYAQSRLENYTRVSLLMAGFFACMLIRELDFLFDEWRHGSWVYFALVIAMIASYKGFLDAPRAWKELAEYTKTQEYEMLSMGLMAILVLSRLFGMGILWQAILEGGYARVAKNSVEEGLELWGYLLALVAVLRHYVRVSKDHSS